MQITLRPVLQAEREILANLLEKYNYELSQYDKRDVNSLGLYGYAYLDYYWTEPNRFAYFIEADGKLAGFAMVNNTPEAKGQKTDFCLSEFFVLYKCRRIGVGRRAFLALLDLHRGTWQLKRHPANFASVTFWDKMVAEATGGAFTLLLAYKGTEYGDGTPADVFLFDNRNEPAKAAKQASVFLPIPRPVDPEKDRAYILECHCRVNYEYDTAWARQKTYAQYRAEWLALSSQTEAFWQYFLETRRKNSTVADILEMPDGTRAGFVWAPLIKDEESGFAFLEIQDIIIEEPFRRKGLARSVYETLERHAKNAGARVLRAGTGIENKTSLALHQRLGFCPYRIEFEKQL